MEICRFCQFWETLFLKLTVTCAMLGHFKSHWKLSAKDRWNKKGSVLTAAVAFTLGGGGYTPPRNDMGPAIPYLPEMTWDQRYPLLWTDRRLWKHYLPLRSAIKAAHQSLWFYCELVARKTMATADYDLDLDRVVVSVCVDVLYLQVSLTLDWPR